jgi:hypothetical protein
VRHVADITLIENSTAGNAPKSFTAQTVEVRHEADIVITGADGPTSAGKRPSKVLWIGGTANDLANITDVKIIGRNGEVLVDAALNVNFDAPRDVAGGVEFAVLAG